MKTDDVLKALKKCRGLGCINCPYFTAGTAKCVDDLMEDAADIINRQKAEIDRQEATILSLKKNGTITYQLNLDEEKMERIKNECLMRIDYNVKEIRADAIKTFAEKMKGIIPEIDDTYIERIVEDYIEKTVNEMTEERDGTAQT